MSGREERNGIDLDDLFADEDYISWESDERGPQPEDFITDADRRRYDAQLALQARKASPFMARAWQESGGRMNEEGDPATVIAFMDAAKRMRISPDVADRWISDTTGRSGMSVLTQFARTARVPSSEERKKLHGYVASVAEAGRHRLAMRELDAAFPEMAGLRHDLHDAQIRIAEADRTVSDPEAGSLARTFAEATMRRYRHAADRILPRLAELERETGYDKEESAATIEERFCMSFAFANEDIILGGRYGQKAMDRAAELCDEIGTLRNMNMLVIAGKTYTPEEGRRPSTRKHEKERKREERE